MRVAAPASLLIAAALAGCGGGGEGRSELVVFAASSLGPAFERYAEGFADAEARFSFAGSDDLAAQIRQGVTPDVYAAANTELPEDLATEGLVGEPRTFATNELVIGVPPGSPIEGVRDLEERGLALAIGDEAVPVGRYTREALSGLGEDSEQAILANVATSEPDVAGIVAKLTQGAVDAGFVYRSDVEAASGRLEAVPLPASVDPRVAYSVAVASDAEHPDEARAFVDGLLAGEGQGILLEAGFGAPPR